LPYNAGKVNISVLDISGSVMFELKDCDSQSAVIKGLKSGVYFVFFVRDNKSR
jgi:hypothetical protein